MADEPWEDVPEIRERYDQEVPFSTFGGDWVVDRFWKATPHNATEALMSDEIFVEPVDNDEYAGYNLSGREIDVLNCRVQAGLSVRETARLLDMPRATVHRLERTALDKIRKILEQK